MFIDEQLFGITNDSQPIQIYRLENNNGIEARIMTYGATLVSLRVPDSDGAPAASCSDLTNSGRISAAMPILAGLLEDLPIASVRRRFS